MKPATKKALLESIEHWRENENVGRIEDAKTGPENCALCRRFRKQKTCSIITKSEEEECPVRISTGYSFCNATPYPKANAAHRLRNLETFREYAKEEREFLESLLPEEK